MENLPEAHTIEQVEALQSLLGRYSKRTDDDDFDGRNHKDDDDDAAADTSHNDGDDNDLVREDDADLVRLCVAYSHDPKHQFSDRDHVEQWCRVNGFDLVQVTASAAAAAAASITEEQQQQQQQLVSGVRLLADDSEDVCETIDTIRESLLCIRWAEMSRVRGTLVPGTLVERLPTCSHNRVVRNRPAEQASHLQGLRLEAPVHCATSPISSSRSRSHRTN